MADLRLGARVARTMAWSMVGLVAVLVAVSTYAVHRGFREAEDAYVRRNVSRMLRAIEEMGASLDRSVQDWAYWDDTYDYARARNRPYEDANLVPSTFATLDIDALLILDRTGKPRWWGTPPTGGPTDPDWVGALTRMAASGGPLAGDGRYGLVDLGSTPAVCAARPILTSDRRGPARGVLVMVRRLSAERIRSVSERMLIEGSVRRLAPSMDDRAAQAATREPSGISVEARGSRFVSGFAVLRDVSGAPVALVRADLPRDIHQVAIRTVTAVGLVAIGAALIYAAWLMVAMRRQVIARVESLDDQLKRVATENPTADAIRLSGADEIADLATSINGMLARIADAQEAEATQRRLYQSMFEGMQEGFAVHEIIRDDSGLPVDYRFIAVNPAFEAMTGFKADAVLGRTVREVLPGIEPEWIERYRRTAHTGESDRFEQWSGALDKHFEVAAFCPAPGQFACVFTDITDRKKAAEAQRAGEAQVKRLLERQTAINRLALALGEGPTLADVYRILHEHVAALVDAWFFVISAFDEPNRQIVAEYAVSGDSVFDVSEFPALPLGEPDSGTQSRVIHSGEPLYSPDHRASIRDSSRRYTVEDDGSVHAEVPEEEERPDTTRSAVYLPMKVGGRTVGILQVQSARLDAYSPEDIEMLAGFANVAAIAIQDARLRADMEREVEGHRRSEEKVRELLAESDRARAALLGILEDVRRTQQDLSQSEERFALAFRTSPYAIAITRLSDGAFVDVNEGFTAIAGYARDEALASSSVMLGLWADPEDRARVIAALQRGESVNGEEYRFITKDGRFITGLFSAHLLELRGEACVLSSINDITARKRAEEMLRVRLRLTEHAAQNPLGELLQQTLDEAERLTGSSIGFYHFVEPDERTLTLQAWSTRTRAEYCKAEGDGLHYPIDEAGVWVDCIRERQAVVHNDYEALTHRKGLPEGHAALVRELVVPILRGGKVVAILGVGNKPTEYTDEDVETVTHLADFAWEIAERKRAEEAHRALQEQLAHALKMESIGRLAGGVAHDYNNMLMVVLGTCDLLEAAIPTGSPASKHVGRIRRASERAWALTQRLLAFSRRQPVQTRVLDVNDMVRSVSEMLDRLIGEHIALQLKLTAEATPVKADPSQMEQALTNLLVNARDAMPNGGTVTIETAAVTFDEPAARMHADVTPGAYVMLAVTDTGMGMDESVRRRLFEPFFTTKATGQGTGLGLPSVYGTVKQMGGFIQVDSELGQGSSFRLYLPFADEAPEPLEEASPASERGHGETVMVIEDEEPLRDVLRAMITDLGYRPRAFASGHDALAAVGQGDLRPALVMTDIVMPEMSGPEVAERLRALLPKVPVVFMSGYADSATMQDVETRSDAQFLAKPFTRAALASALGSRLSALGSSLSAHGRTVLMVDDDADARELTQIACRRRGHSLIGVGTVQDAIAALDRQSFDVLLIDNNVGALDAEAILRAIREAGNTTPALVYTGDAGSVDPTALEGLNVIAIVEKAYDHKALIEQIEAI